MNPVRVKICGITRVEDAIAALRFGADAIGLVFYEKSPRFVDISTARAIASAVGPFVTVVGLFVNAERTDVSNVLEKVGLDILQFHGDEDEAYCRQFGRSYLKAIRMRPDLDIAQEVSRYQSAKGLLFDAWEAERFGGTGESFEWQRLPKDMPLPLILAGGLNPSNVAEAVTQVRPYAVDVSGGVESGKGKKDFEKMINFIREAVNGTTKE